MKHETFLIVANGLLNENIVNKIDLYQLDRVVAADGGAVQAIELGLVPDVIIGDLDSIPKNFALGSDIIQEPSQEYNDLEKSLRYCKKNGARQVIVVGIAGGRADHTLNNFSVLAKFADQFNLKIVTGHATIFVVKNSFSISCRTGQTISLIPWGTAGGITTSGLRYPLKNESLQLGVREGASNEAVSDRVEITLNTGTLLVFVNDDQP